MNRYKLDSVLLIDHCTLQYCIRLFNGVLKILIFQCTVIQVLISLEYYRLGNRYRLDSVHRIDQCHWNIVSGFCELSIFMVHSCMITSVYQNMCQAFSLVDDKTVYSALLVHTIENTVSDWLILSAVYSNSILL